MSKIFIDCETCGLPVSSNRNIPAKQTNNWPHIVQLSWIIQNSFGRIIKEADYIIKPRGYVISEESTKIHGISHQTAVEKGEDICAILRILSKDISNINSIVCHNASFDLKVLEASYYRCKIPCLIHNKKQECTMKNPKVIEYCAIPFNNHKKYSNSKQIYKWPRLEELYRKCFDMDFPNAHNSMYDARATRECYNFLVENSIIS